MIEGTMKEEKLLNNRRNYERRKIFE
jgi:hypothetical protein